MTERVTGAPNGEGLNLHHVRLGEIHRVEDKPVLPTHGPSITKYRAGSTTYDNLEIVVDRTTGCMAFVGVVIESLPGSRRSRTNRYILDQDFEPLYHTPLRGIVALTPQSVQGVSAETPPRRMMFTQESVNYDPPKVETRVDTIDAGIYLDHRNGDSAADLAAFVERLGHNLQHSPRLALEHQFIETPPQQTQETPQRVESELNANFRLLPVKRDDLGRLVPEGTEKYGPAYNEISVVVDTQTGFVGVVGVRDRKSRLVDSAYEEIVYLPTGAEVIGFSQKGIHLRGEDGTCWNFEFTHPGYLATEITDPGSTVVEVTSVDVGHDITGDKIARILEDKELGIAQPRLFPGTFNESAQAAVSRQEVTEPPALDANFRLSPVSGDGFGRLVPEGVGQEGPVYSDISVVVDPDTGIVGILGMEDDGREYVLDAAYNKIGLYAQQDEVIVGFSETGIDIKPSEMSAGDNYRFLHVFSVFEGHDITGDKIVEKVRELGIAEPRLFPGSLIEDSAQQTVKPARLTSEKVSELLMHELFSGVSVDARPVSPAPIPPAEAKESLIRALQFALTDPLAEESGVSRYRVINGLVTALVTRFRVGGKELKEIIGTEVLEVPSSVIKTAGVVVEQLSHEQRNDTQRDSTLQEEDIKPDLDRVGDSAVVPHAEEVAEYLRRKVEGSAASGDPVRVATEEEGVGFQDNRDPVRVYAFPPPKSMSLGSVSVSVGQQAENPVFVENTPEGRTVTRKRPPSEPKETDEQSTEEFEASSPRVARLLRRFVGIDPDREEGGGFTVHSHRSDSSKAGPANRKTAELAGNGGEYYDTSDDQNRDSDRGESR